MVQELLGRDSLPPGQTVVVAVAAQDRRVAVAAAAKDRRVVAAEEAAEQRLELTHS